MEKEILEKTWVAGDFGNFVKQSVLCLARELRFSTFNKEGLFLILRNRDSYGIIITCDKNITKQMYS